MKYWYTEITAIDPQSNKLSTYQGPIVKGLSIMDAEKFCKLNCPYACVIGEIVMTGEIDEKYVINRVIDYEDIANN